jgi:hypothetical protein
MKYSHPVHTRQIRYEAKYKTYKEGDRQQQHDYSI